MYKVNTRGIKQANKCMLMAGSVFNLKKLLKYSTRKTQEGKRALKKLFSSFLDVLEGIYLRNKTLFFFRINY